MNLFKTAKKLNLADQAVWTVSWVSGEYFDRKRNKPVQEITELTVVGTANMQRLAQSMIASLILDGGMHPYNAHEAVQVKRAGWLH